MDVNSTWLAGPVGLGAEHRVTRVGCRTVLVMVPTVTAGHRVTDLVALLSGDHRVQTIYTVPHGFEHWDGPRDFVRRRQELYLPWPQALQHTFDLVLSASHREIHRVHGNVLVLPHGAGSVMSRRHSRKAGGATVETTGLDRELLTYRGRVIPAAIALTHDDELDVLRDRCPEALDRAVVAGDIAQDRLTGSQDLRARYRAALGVADDQLLVTVSSTWSEASTFGQHAATLYHRVLDELPAGRTRVAAVLHPNIWAVHGRGQVRAWLADCLRDGLLLIPPEAGWQATMIASDRVLGDHGSCTIYAAALGLPVLLAAFPDEAIRPGSIADLLARSVGRLRHDRPLAPQLAAATPAADGGAALADAITSRPGQAATLLRAAMYRLLELPPPDSPAPTSPLPVPCPITAGEELS